MLAVLSDTQAADIAARQPLHAAAAAVSDVPRPAFLQLCNRVSHLMLRLAAMIGCCQIAQLEAECDWALYMPVKHIWHFTLSCCVPPSLLFAQNIPASKQNHEA